MMLAVQQNNSQVEKEQEEDGDPYATLCEWMPEFRDVTTDEVVEKCGLEAGLFLKTEKLTYQFMLVSILLKNSSLVLQSFILSRRNSIASTVPIEERIFLKINTFWRSPASNRRSSFLVPDF